MFQFFYILLLLTPVLHIVEAIKIWVKPSDLRYTAEISCLHRKRSITIGTATHASPGRVGTTGYVNIGADLSRCDDHHNSTVKVRITNLDRPNDSMEFEMSKVELSARKSAVVLGFNIAPSAHKIFYFIQSSSIFRYFQQSPLGVSQRPLVDYELEIECDYQPDYTTQYIVFGSKVQKHGQNNINIPIYETEMLAFCGRGRIGLAIRNAEHARTTFIELTKESFLENDAFNINIKHKTVRFITQGHNAPPVLSRTIESLSTIPSGASSSTTGQVESSTIATVHDEASNSFSSQVEEMEPKQQSENNESVSGKNICVICQDKQVRVSGQVESSTFATTHDEASTSSQAAKTESEVDEMESKQQSENKESVSGKNIC